MIFLCSIIELFYHCTKLWLFGWYKYPIQIKSKSTLANFQANFIFILIFVCYYFIILKNMCNNLEKQFISLMRCILLVLFLISQCNIIFFFSIILFFKHNWVGANKSGFTVTTYGEAHNNFLVLEWKMDHNNNDENIGERLAGWNSIACLVITFRRINSF